MPPILYLVRHAHASDAPHDELRPVSPRGREQVRALVALLKQSTAFTPAEVWHSPLLRARETAELVMESLKLKATWHERRELEPEADPTRVAHLLAKTRTPLALFGHEPHLSSLASLLVTGESSPVVFAFRKATMAALEPAGPRWCVRWMIAPDMLGV